MLHASTGIPAGRLHDSGHFRLLFGFGSLLYIFSYVRHPSSYAPLLSIRTQVFHAVDHSSPSILPSIPFSRSGDGFCARDYNRSCCLRPRPLFPCSTIVGHGHRLCRPVLLESIMKTGLNFKYRILIRRRRRPDHGKQFDQEPRFSMGNTVLFRHLEEFRMLIFSSQNNCLPASRPPRHCQHHYYAAVPTASSEYPYCEDNRILQRRALHDRSCWVCFKPSLFYYRRNNPLKRSTIVYLGLFFPCTSSGPFYKPNSRKSRFLPTAVLCSQGSR